MKISLIDLQKASKEFKAASQASDEIMANLKKVMENLESTWEDANQQTFYQYYQEWHNHARGVSQLLNLTADELNAIAERYFSADSDTPVVEK